MTVALRDFVLQSVFRPQLPRLRISLAGSQCERSAFYSAIGAEGEPEKPESLIKMALGSAFDAYALTEPKRNRVMSNEWAFQFPVELSIGGLTVNGTADAVWFNEDCKMDHVADLKTVGSKTWAKVQNKPKQEHQAQVQLYAWGLGAPSWSVLYVNADTGEMLEHFGRVDEFEVRRDWGMFETVAYHMAKGEPPPRPYADEEDEDGNVTKRAKDSFPCGWCRFKTTCWEGDKTNVTVQNTGT